MKKIILTCEHGGNEIPSDYRKYFNHYQELLNTHRGLDLGSLDIAQKISLSLGIPLYKNTITRLLVEPNRSLHHPNLFSEISAQLPEEEKKRILDQYYFPYRNKVEKAIHQAVDEEREVIHISIHSFTPDWQEAERNCDIGFLYDPKRKQEKIFCKLWKKNLKTGGSNWKVRFNYPYRGIADGFTTYLRKRFYKNYSGIEVEINQKLLLDPAKETISKDLINSLRASIQA